MRTLVTYGRMTLLAIALLSIPILAQAQMGSSLPRERDSLINLISHETDEQTLAVLYCQLAERYSRLGQNGKFVGAAEKAVTYASNCKDYGTLAKSQILLGDNYVLKDDAENAIKKYLSARSTLEKKFSEERQKYIDEQTEKGVKKEEIKELERPVSEVEADADIVVKIGEVYFNRGHYIHSIDDFSDALITYESIGAEEKAIDMKQRLAISYYQRGDYESSLEYYDALLEYYKGKNDWESTKMVYQRLNDISDKMKDYDKVLAYNRALYNDCIAHNNIRESLNALNNVAYTYVCLGDYEKAAKYYQQLLDTDPKVSGDEHFMASNYTNLGLCYQNMGDDASAIDNLKKAAELRLKYSQDREASEVENIIALIYHKNEDLHNAEYYAQYAVRDARNSGDNDTKMSAYQTYNKVLQAKGEYQEALNYYQQYLNIRDSVQLQQIIKDREMSEDLRKLTDAENSFRVGLQEQVNKELEYERLNMQLQAKAEELRNREELARMERQREQERMEQQQKELENQINMQRLEREKADKEKQIAKQEAEIARREADRINQERENAELKAAQEKAANQLELQKSREKNMRLILYLAAVAVLGALAFILVVRKKNSRLKAQQAEIEAKNETLQMKNDEIISINQEITKQKAVIEEANKSMTDSIVYAKRIQTAVSPNPSFLSKYNYDYFMFFRPRDIVSGDYYWFYADKQDHLFIVAADCTGHGVPGAFMSMLGVSLFNKIVAERQVAQPDLILNEMRKEVKLALHQDSINSSQKDGMDLSLVRIDLDTMMMHFAAANNNGYLLREYDESQREEISKDLAKPEYLRELGNGKLLKTTIMPADPMPIGVYLREKESFTMTSYQLRPGDSFFLTSDGYVDQFGGKYGRKFLSRNFIKLLMDLHGKPMAEQEKTIIDTHDNWRGLEYDQLDDIIVIGVQV